MRFGASWNTSVQRVLILTFLRKKFRRYTASWGKSDVICPKMTGRNL